MSHWHRKELNGLGRCTIRDARACALPRREGEGRMRPLHLPLLLGYCHSIGSESRHPKRDSPDTELNAGAASRVYSCSWSQCERAACTRTRISQMARQPIHSALVARKGDPRTEGAFALPATAFRFRGDVPGGGEETRAHNTNNRAQWHRVWRTGQVTA